MKLFVLIIVGRGRGGMAGELGQRSRGHHLGRFAPYLTLICLAHGFFSSLEWAHLAREKFQLGKNSTYFSVYCDTYSQIEIILRNI